MYPKEYPRTVTALLVLNFAIIIHSPKSLTLAKKVANGTSKIDLTKCKLTQLGTEYIGQISQTIGGIRCQAWYSEEPLHQVSEDIKDQDFPEKSIRDAKNYCRNPTMDPRGPWCYTLDPALIDDKCDIPLCNFGECRVSGVGAEYGGSRKVSASGKKCKSWRKHYKLIDTKSAKFDEKQFPEQSVRKAGSFCRNPTSDVGGPWCYVDQEDLEYVEKEFCDVLFCDDKDCLTYTKNATIYTTITSLNAPEQNVSFWIKLWNPVNEKTGEARILLSLLPIPSSAKEIAEEWNAGVELVFANVGSRQKFPTYGILDEEESLESTPHVLLGTKWTRLWILWAGGFISVGLHGETKPFIMQEYKKEHSITNLYQDTFLYYGVQGTGVLWSSDFCQTHCEVHTTFGIEFSRIWTMEKTNDTNDVRFHVRASRDISIRLYQTPAIEYPSFTLIIESNIISLVFQESDEAGKLFLKEVSVKDLLTFWSWLEFSISIFGAHFRLYVRQVYGNVELLYANHDLFVTLRYFGIGSDKTIAHWTLFCEPEERDTVEDPWPPNCLSDLKDYTYKGSQWTSVDEIPCAPWISSQVPEEEKTDNSFVDGSALKALNKCRNPSHDPNGPYCYAFLPWQTPSVAKRYCSIRNCKSTDCKMAGTANDYVGKLMTTRSGRHCTKWLLVDDLQIPMTENVLVPTLNTSAISRRGASRVKPRMQKSVLSKLKGLIKKKDNRGFERECFNDSRYPEGSAQMAKNYCRNPSRNIAGTWCYTTDPLVPQDLCDVRDCERSESYTFLIRGKGTGRRMYVLPEYRSEGLRFSLKAWEPDQPDSITFVFTADDALQSRYILKIDAFDNEKVVLYYRSEDEEVTLVKKKTLPHLLYLGKWSNFLIRIPRGRILLYYQGAPDPLFEWNHPVPSDAFLPVYYYYGSEKGHTIGVAFYPDSSCHIENTITDHYSTIFPVSAWSEREIPRPNKMTLLLRGKGVVSIPLLLLPSTPEFYTLVLSESNQNILLTKDTYLNQKMIIRRQKTSKPLFLPSYWTNITVMWLENEIDVLCNETNVFHYKHSNPIIFYFFSLGVAPGGWATWTINCIPIDIDGSPLDGGWSEWGAWACSASCNGGTGTRKRLCNSPKPNVRGEPCIGPSTMTGRCNEIICGDITDDTMAMIKRRIRANYTALTVKEKDSISILSDPDVVKSIRTESPRSELQWSLNGIFVQEEPDRIEIKDYDIAIERATASDSGVYAMTLHRVDGTQSIVKVISLAVIPEVENVLIRETMSMSVTCKCVILGHVYTDLDIFWTIENNTWKDYGTTLPILVDVDHIPAVNQSHKGHWLCIVKQYDLNFEWVTNAIFVKGPPNWRTHLMEDEATRFIFGWLPNENYVVVLALIISLILIAAIIAGSVIFIRLRENFRRNATGEKGEKKRQNKAGYQQLPRESKADTEGDGKSDQRKKRGAKEASSAERQSNP